MGGRIILEGVLKVYWGLKMPVTLASHNLAYWRRRSQKEQNGLTRASAVKNKDSIVSKFGAALTFLSYTASVLIVGLLTFWYSIKLCYHRKLLLSFQFLDFSRTIFCDTV